LSQVDVQLNSLHHKVSISKQEFRRGHFFVYLEILGGDC
jgi:hypothetical protein